MVFVVNHTKIIFNEKKKNIVQYIGKYNLLFMDIIILVNYTLFAPFTVSVNPYTDAVIMKL